MSIISAASDDENHAGFVDFFMRPGSGRSLGKRVGGELAIDIPDLATFYDYMPEQRLLLMI